MHKLEHRTDLYMDLSVEAHQAFQYIKQYHVDADLLLPVHSSLEQNIMTSIERLSHQSVSLPNVSREIVEYASSLKQAALRYLDVIEKQKTLIVDSISPLVKANTAFKEIYGAKKFLSLENTEVHYFNRDYNHPRESMDDLSAGILSHDPDHIRVSCHEYMNCKVTDGQLEYPNLSELTSTSMKPLIQHGYTMDDFTLELQKLTGEKSDMLYLKLVAQKQDIIKRLNQLTDHITMFTQELRPQYSGFKKCVNLIMQEVGDLQSYNVALSTVMFLLQSASSAAYEAGYKIHLAELNFQNY